MQYNEIYKIVIPVMDWIKEHYPHNHVLVISATGAELQETGKLIIVNKKEWEETMESINKSIPEILETFASEIKRKSEEHNNE